MDLSQYSTEDLKRMAGIDQPKTDLSSYSTEDLYKMAGIEKPKREPLTPEQRAEVRKQGAELLKDMGVNTSGWGVAGDALKGLGNGLVSGTERIANGVTLGGYDWASDKLGLGSTERKKELEDLNSAIKYANLGTEFTGGLATGGGLLGGSMKLAKAIPTATKAGKVAGNLAKLSVYPATGAIEGGLSSAFSGGSFKDGAENGAILGSVIPASLWGVGKGLSAGIPRVLGLTTGSGERAIKTAFDAGKRKSSSFINNMRGTADKEEVVNMAQKSLKDLKVARNAEYSKAMSEIKGKEGVELKPIIDKFKQISKTEAGGKKYLIDDDTAKFLKDAEKKIRLFSKDQAHRSLGDYDDLKQAIGNIKISKEAVRAQKVQSELYGAIKDEIKKQAPVYDKIMQPYSKAADEIRNIEKALSLGKGKKIDTSLRKLQSALRNNVASNYGNRGDLVNKLGNSDLSDALSGQLLNSWLPRGLQAQMGSGGIGYAVSQGMANPASLAAFSPRIVGETTYGLGRLSNLINKVAIPTVKRATFMDIIGRLNRKGEK